MFDRAQFLRPIAHRGLHDAARGVIENTSPAFEAAVEAKKLGLEAMLSETAASTIRLSRKVASCIQSRRRRLVAASTDGRCCARVLAKRT